MEPNDIDGGVPDVDFTIDTASGRPRAVSEPAPTWIAPTPIDSHPIDPALFGDEHGSSMATAHVRFTSFEEFYTSSRTSVGRALALTLRNDDLAREAVDEAMARAFQRWAHVSQLDNPGGWVYRVGLNWSRSVVRRWKRPTPIWIAQPEATPHSTPPDPSIDRALDQLSLDHRSVVVCRLLLGLSELQTADALGIRPGTVKSRLARALDRLHPLLSPLHSPLQSPSMAPSEENPS